MLLSWIAPRRENGEALAFIRALAHEAVLPYCILAAHKGREGLDVATLNPCTDEARGWLAKRVGRKVYAVTAQTSGPLRGRAISESDIVQTRIVGVAIPAARRAVLHSFRPAPSIIARTPRGLALVQSRHAGQSKGTCFAHRREPWGRAARFPLSAPWLRRRPAFAAPQRV